MVEDDPSGRRIDGFYDASALDAVSLLLLRRRPAQGVLLTRLTLAGALVSFGLLARVGSLGGQIMHPETRNDALSNKLGK